MLYVAGRIVFWEEEEEEGGRGGEGEEVNTRMDFGFLCIPSLHPRNAPTIIANAEILLLMRELPKKFKVFTFQI